MNTLYISCSNEIYNNFYNVKANLSNDCGFDIFCPEDVIVPKNRHSFIINMKIKCRFEVNNVNKGFMITPRSSMGSKTPLRLSNSIGIIDPSYRGDLMVIVDNLSDYDFKVIKGSRLVQAVSFNGEHINNKYEQTLDSTERGEGGLGSTGR